MYPVLQAAAGVPGPCGGGEGGAPVSEDRSPPDLRHHPGSCQGCHEVGVSGAWSEDLNPLLHPTSSHPFSLPLSPPSLSPSPLLSLMRRLFDYQICFGLSVLFVALFVFWRRLLH